MVTVTKFLTKLDLKREVCDCEGRDKLKILFKEVNETELRIKPKEDLQGANVLRYEKIVAYCENCKNIYFIMLTFEGSLKEQYVSIDSIELFEGSLKDLRRIINEMYDGYENELINIATDDHSIKVIDKLEDEEKIITQYAYLNREDKELYADLMG